MLAIVTGGSRGIGAATALLLAQAGYGVVVNYRNNAAAAQQVVNSIQQQGGQAWALQADVAHEDQVERLFLQADQMGPLKALVNNAGTLESQMRLEQTNAARWQRLWATNVLGSMACCKQAVLRMAYRYGGQGGSIVNVSSVAAKLGAPGEYIDYAACKGAIDSLTVGLAKEVANQGIRVNAVRPGIIHTEIHSLGGEPQRPERLGPSLPMQRAGYPQEVAHSIVWLLSDAASYVSGALLDVAGAR